MRTVCQHITLHSLLTFHHADMRGSRLRNCVPKTVVCRPRVMSRSLPHLTLTTSTSSFSPTSPILQSSSSTHPSLLSHDPYFHCDDSRRSCGSSDLQSSTGYEPKGSSSTGIFRLNIKVKHETELWEMTINVQSITEDMDEFGKLLSSLCPATSQ